MKTWIPLILLILVAAAAWYFLRPDTPPPETVEAPPPVLQPVEPEPEPEPPMPSPPPPSEPPGEETMPEPEALPLLAESDPDARAALGSLVGEAMAARYFAGDNIVSRLVATVDALDSRQVPAVIQAVDGPDSEFQATADERPFEPILNEQGDPIPQFVLDSANFSRYRVYVEMLEAADAGELVALYRQNEPLFEEAYRQLGYPEGGFNTRLAAIIDQVLAAPEVDEPLRLIKPEAYYLFADESLESLPAGQKVLLRMGPENAARVKAKLAEIRDALEAAE
ncbi:MAG: DUF3014 domain-containing protein [Xanthomonadales bacterium]|nr:DUF3014 domain-containing protein [Xanthomonadales bacterium]